MNDFENDISIVILTHNRQHCLDSVLPFWEKTSLRTIVVDQSPKPYARAGNFTNLEYFYIDAPFAQRCKVASELINSQYAIVISDDELYLRSGLEAMWETLKKDANLVSVGGVAISVWKYGPQTCGAWPYSKTFRLVNKGQSPLERVALHTGNGFNPMSSFFTSNLCKSDYLKHCLRLYGKSKSIATEAISLLTICGGGQSEYIDSLYWIRNWNEAPRSHQGWDRSLMIHKWWELNQDNEIGRQFRKDLMDEFAKFADITFFDEIWGIIMRASRTTEPKNLSLSSASWQSYSHLINYAKWALKSVAARNSLPKNYQQVLDEMNEKGVRFRDAEVEEAISIVEKLRPYKEWKREKWGNRRSNVY